LGVGDFDLIVRSGIDGKSDEAILTVNMFWVSQAQAVGVCAGDVPGWVVAEVENEKSGLSGFD
jgi:hypothetical protein